MRPHTSSWRLPAMCVSTSALVGALMHAEHTTGMFAALALSSRSPIVLGSMPEMWMPFGLRARAAEKPAR
ncbi:unannotated protein [freshwater metagenome]|uniref:Unannotated protein n=1 Tax=freshwater metagenome TaxID=449393 RepID=A0A6J7M0R6_9ZZZZ